jgi:hypothetical protein
MSAEGFVINFSGKRSNNITSHNTFHFSSSADRIEKPLSNCMMRESNPPKN